MIPRNVKKWKNDVYVSGNSFIFVPYNAKKSGNMKTKPYPLMEEKPTMANEPVVAYGSTAYASLYQPTSYEMEVIMKSKEEFRQGLFYTQDEVDKMVEEWLS